MVRLFTLIGFIFITVIGFTQSDFTSVDANSRTVPDSLTDYSHIAIYLCRDLQSDTEKVRAIYIWVSHNIKYDLEQLNSRRRYRSANEIIDAAMHERKGVCQHYSEHLHAMCKAVDLKSYVISGYTLMEDGAIANLSHAWNAVSLESGFYQIDATWAAGYKHNNTYVHTFRDEYFLIEPEIFIKPTCHLIQYGSSWRIPSLTGNFRLRISSIRKP